MKSKSIIPITFIIILSLIVIVSSASTVLNEYNYIAGTHETDFTSGQRLAQTWTIGTVGTNKTITVSKVGLMLSEGGADATVVTFELREVDPATGKPTAVIRAKNLTTLGYFPAKDSEVFINLTLNNSATLDNTKAYAIVMYTADANPAYIRDDSGGNGYAGGIAWISGDGGASWGSLGGGSAYDFAFEIYDDSGTTPSALTVTQGVPTNNTKFSSSSITFNTTLVPTETNLTNASIYVWNPDSSLLTVNENAVTGNVNNVTSWSLSGFSFGKNMWSVRGCGINNSNDVLCSWSENRTFNWGYSINTVNYSNATLEGSTESFSLNLTLGSGVVLNTAYLIYNGTRNLASITSSGTSRYITESFTIPETSASATKNIIWELNFGGGNGQINLTGYKQTINVLAIDNCTTYTYPLFNITLYDEKEQTMIDPSAENTTIDLSFTLTSSTDNKELLNFSTRFKDSNPALICLQNDLGSAQYTLDGVIQYGSKNRFTEFYHFQDYNLINSTADMNINLYNLNVSQGTEFKITYKDSNFIPVEGAIFNIQRKYIDEGVFKTTEIPKTGTEGYTIAHLVRNDIIYNIIVQKNGEVLATFEDVVADCQNPLLSTCQINLNSYSSSSLPSDFTNYNDISFTLTYDRSSREVASVFTIPSGIVSTVSLNVSLFDNLGNQSVCATGIESAGGSLSCAVPLSFGNTTIIAKLYKDGDVVGQSIIRMAQDPSDIYGGNLIFVALLLFLVIAGIGATSDNPMVMGIILALGSLVMVALNILYSPSWVGAGATVLWFIVAIILIIIKGGSRQ